MDLSRPTARPWESPADYWGGMTAATASLDTPVGALNRSALAHNAHDMLDRAQGTTIRVASKSIRVRGVIEQVLSLPGYAGVLAYTLPEALWLAETVDDVVVGYPSVDREAIRTLATSPDLARRVTVMVDSTAQLDAIDSVLLAGKRESIRVCLELDASWDAPLLGHIGVYRSPVHSVADARALASEIVARPGFELVGIMAYEAQIAGLTNRPPGRPVLGNMDAVGVSGERRPMPTSTSDAPPPEVSVIDQRSPELAADRRPQTTEEQAAAAAPGFSIR